MLKFKSTDNTENGFDLVEISSAKTKENTDNDYKKDDIFGLFIELFSCSEGLNSLKSFLITTNLWDLLLSPSEEEFPLIKSTIIHYYFSIPDRVSAAFKLETDEFFFSRNFQSFTEETLLQSFTDSYKLKRFMFALERLDGFALHKLVKIDFFWDSLDFELFSQLSSTKRQLFLASLFKNLLSRDFSFKKLCKIITKLSENLRFETEILVNLFFEEFISKGLLDYRNFSQLISAFSVTFKDSNRFLSSLMKLVLKTWSNDSWIFRTPFNSQLHYSSCLMIISSLISSDLFKSDDIEESLMNGVQTRLDHSDAQIRLLGTCVAEILNQMHPESESKLDFGLDPKNEIVLHLKDCQKQCGVYLFGNSGVKGLVEDTDINGNIYTVNDNVIYTAIDTATDTDTDDDLKPISSLLKEEEAKNSKTPIPRFLPDCLKLLRANEDAELVEKVLIKFEDTFKSSSRLSRQIHCVSAFNTLLNLTDHFELKDFDELRQNTMKTVLIDQIKIVGPELIDSIFKSNKLVLNQKMEIFSLICSTTQQIFVSKSPKNLEFEKTFLISETTQNKNKNKTTKEKTNLINEFLENLCLPLFIQSIRNFEHFKRNHVMFLEKFLWLQAIILNFSQNYLPFDNLVERYLDFVHLTLNASKDSSKVIEQIPIQKALLLGTSVVLSSWPAKLSVIQFYQRLQEIYSFLDEVANGPGFQEDEQLQTLGTSVALALQDLTDPQKLLKESAEQMTLDLKSVKITNLSLT